MATIKVKESTLNKVKKIAKKQLINNGEFVDLAADFFIKTGLDLDADYSIKTEISKNTKRLNEVIATIKAHEKNKLVPTVNAILRASKYLTETESKLTRYVQAFRPNAIVEMYNEVATTLEEVIKQNVKLIEESEASRTAHQETVLKMKEEYKLDLEKAAIENKAQNHKMACLMELMLIDKGIISVGNKRVTDLKQELVSLNSPKK